MQLLIGEDLPRSTGNLVRTYGHKAIDVRDIGLRGAKDSQIASYAQSRDLCIVTGDFDFSDIRNYPPALHAGLIVLRIPGNATALFSSPPRTNRKYTLIGIDRIFYTNSQTNNRLKTSENARKSTTYDV